MPTLNQLVRGVRAAKKKKNKAPALKGAPFKNPIVKEVFKK
jgi:ribosomal protein S12